MSIEYKIIRRPRRKSAAICVKPDCSVSVLVPLTLPDETIAELVQQKSNWIKSKISRFQSLRYQYREKEYVSGESFRYLGRTYRLSVATGEGGAVKLLRGRFHIQVSPGIHGQERKQFLKGQLDSWYQEHALPQLIKKTEWFARRVGVTPSSVGIKGYRSRWGSCHRDGRIYFNWRIVRAPHHIIDYLVVHELCHLVHADHSRNFWRCVERILPDHAERRKWLKEHGRWLEI